MDWGNSYIGQLGLEPDISSYLDHLLQILDTECRRVLKPSGVMWVNISDSYNSGSRIRPDGGAGMRSDNTTADPFAPLQGGLKPLNLCMIPARFALAMQQRGWYLRSIVPWLKRAAMPDSVQGDRWEQHKLKVKPQPKGRYPSEKTGQAIGGWNREQLGNAEWANCPGCPKCLPNDGLVLRHGNWRPGRSMEWLFLFSKTNSYYADAEGVRLPQASSSRERYKYARFGPDNKANRPDAPYAVSGGNYTEQEKATGRNRRESDWLYESLDAIIASHEREARRLKHLRDNGGMLWEDGEPLALLLNPKGYKEAHFATYPIAMVEPLIKAYTSDKGNCPGCGAPWIRIIKRHTEQTAVASYEGKWGEADKQSSGYRMSANLRAARKLTGQREPSFGKNTLGWRASCQHKELEPIPAVILDPFVGSGTTCAAATKLNRRSIGVDCCPEYIALAVKRLGGPFEVETKEGVRVKQTGLFEGRD